MLHLASLAAGRIVVILALGYAWAYLNDWAYRRWRHWRTVRRRERVAAFVTDIRTNGNRAARRRLDRPAKREAKRVLRFMERAGLKPQTQLTRNPDDDGSAGA